MKKIKKAAEEMNFFIKVVKQKKYIHIAIKMPTNTMELAKFTKEE